MKTRIRTILMLTVDASPEDQDSDGIEAALRMVGKNLTSGALPDVKVSYQVTVASIQIYDEAKEDVHHQ